MNWWRSAILLSLVLVRTVVSMAQSDTVTLQFRHISIKDGLSQGTVNRIIQDRYGFMWFATKDGLDRYDGYDFRIYRNDPKDSTSVRNGYISTMLEDRAGRIWVGTPTGLDVFDRNTETFHHIPCTDAPTHGPMPARVNALPGCTVADLAEDPQGRIWVSTPRGLSRIDPTGPIGQGVRAWPITWVLERAAWMALLIHPDGTLFSATRDTPYIIDTRDPEGRVRPIRIDAPPVTGMPGGRIFRTDMTMVHDSVRNAIYGVYTKGIMRIDAAHATASTLYEDLDQPSLLSGTGAIVDATGRCWLPTQAGGVRRFDPATGRLSAIRSEASDLDPYLQYVKCAYRDRNGLIWLGLSGYGLLTYDPRVERFQLMPGPSIRYMMPGVNGKLVMNEGNFLSVYDPGGRAYDLRLGIVEVRERAGFDQGFWGNDAVVQDRTGAFWASKGGLVRYEHAARSMERAIPTAADPRLPVSSSCFPLKLIGDTLWFGSDSGLFWCDPVSRRYDRLTPYPIVPVNNPYTFLQALHRDARGDFWAGTVKGLFRFDARTRRWTHYHNDPDDPGTLSVDVLFSILPDPHDPEGVLWIGTNGGGLNRFDVRTGKVVRYTTKQGLPNDVVYGVLSDDSGKLWMSTNKGIARFDPETRTFRNFTVADGLQNDEFNRYAYCKLPDGRLCFGGVGGFNIFDPRAMEDDPRAASVILTDIKLRNRSIEFRRAGSPISGPPYESAGMEIPYSDNMVTFEFANVEYAAPHAHRYRYRLDGFDTDWITTVGDHAAIYTNLDPGTYMFRVSGANRDGHWGDAETTFRLVVLPPWWRTWWFYALCTIVVAGGALLYIGSLRRQVRLRTAQLLTEKVRSEDLLNNILPVSVATELKEKGTSQAAYFEQATVLLTDIKDFTRISERMDAALLVDELNTCFKAFDRIMEKYGVEKIRTIGDAYMAVGGVPAPRVGAPQAVVLAGLEMQRIMQERKNELSAAGKPWFEMRLGIHTGPVVAGIVGARKFQYDLWGDTVSIARLMESSGEVGEVNISGATYALVKGEPGAHFTLRGRVNVRGVGELAIYRVHTRSEQVIAEAGPVKRPLATSVPPGHGAEGTPSPPASDQAPRLPQGLRILLAEDNEFNAMVVQGHLENWLPGAKLTHVISGAQAVQAVRKAEFDVVLMDIQMPEMNGYDATKAIRALTGDRSRVPIIAMSANVMKAEIDRCTEAGMNAFVPKPYKREQLLAALADVINGTPAA